MAPSGVSSKPTTKLSSKVQQKLPEKTSISSKPSSAHVISENKVISTTKTSPTISTSARSNPSSAASKINQQKAILPKQKLLLPEKEVKVNISSTARKSVDLSKRPNIGNLKVQTLKAGAQASSSNVRKSSAPPTKVPFSSTQHKPTSSSSSVKKEPQYPAKDSLVRKSSVPKVTSLAQTRSSVVSKPIQVLVTKPKNVGQKQMSVKTGRVGTQPKSSEAVSAKEVFSSTKETVDLSSDANNCSGDEPVTGNTNSVGEVTGECIESSKITEDTPELCDHVDKTSGDSQNVSEVSSAKASTRNEPITGSNDLTDFNLSVVKNAASDLNNTTLNRIIPEDLNQNATRNELISDSDDAYLDRIIPEDLNQNTKFLENETMISTECATEHLALSELAQTIEFTSATLSNEIVVDQSRVSTDTDVPGISGTEFVNFEATGVLEESCKLNSTVSKELVQIEVEKMDQSIEMVFREFKVGCSEVVEQIEVQNDFSEICSSENFIQTTRNKQYYDSNDSLSAQDVEESSNLDKNLRFYFGTDTVNEIDTYHGSEIIELIENRVCSYETAQDDCTRSKKLPSDSDFNNYEITEHFTTKNFEPVSSVSALKNPFLENLKLLNTEQPDLTERKMSNADVHNCGVENFDQHRKEVTYAEVLKISKNDYDKKLQSAENIPAHSLENSNTSKSILTTESVESERIERNETQVELYNKIEGPFCESSQYNRTGSDDEQILTPIKLQSRKKRSKKSKRRRSFQSHKTADSEEQTYLNPVWKSILLNQN